jgi:Protein of unknown function (DUF3300)
MKVERKLNNMSIFERAAGFSKPRSGNQILVSLLPLALLFVAWPQNLSADQDGQEPQQAAQGPQYVQQTPEQLQQLVAPIALYPDSLVAQILAASAFPEQIVEADRWVQAHPDLKGDALGQAVDQQPWDPSVKALTEFPSVLGNMDKNLSWTSSLGDAYYNQEQAVMDAVQVMRQRAQEAGNLKTTEQQTVTTQDSTIIIEPASPEIVYVPAYDPWLVYGGPIEAWPGWYEYPGIWYGGPYLSFGFGYGIGYYGGYGWGWHHWGSDWHHRVVIHDHDRYYSRSRSFYSRNDYYRGGGERGGAGARSNEGNRPPNANAGDRGGFNGDRGADRTRSNEGNRQSSGNTGERAGTGARVNEGNRPPNANAGGRGGAENRPGATARPFEGNNQAARGYAEPRGQSGVRSGAFSNYDHGGQERSFSSRGSASFGGGGGARGGGGGRH